MNKLLLIPIYLDALFLKQEQAVVETMADFSKLPYTDRKRDYNADRANLSEELLSTPFQNQNLYLKAGMHLHFAMPDALTHGSGDGFPLVPNRWLISKSQKNDDGEYDLSAQWIIESDYLFPDGKGTQETSINMPIQSAPEENKHRPFRFMGRSLQMGWDDWQVVDSDEDYYSGLTTLGYGELSFAAFYPNCYSVFGFCDEDAIVEDLNNLKYDAIGWYANPEEDYFRTYLEGQSNQDSDSLLNAIEQDFEWKISPTSEELPSQSFYYSQINFDTNQNNTDRNSNDCDITFGNSGVEALSACLASEIDSDSKEIIEDQLEAIQMLDHFVAKEVDIGLKFEEFRHSKGFTSRKAESIFTIRQHQDESLVADATQTLQIDLPQELAEPLNLINELKSKYNQTWREIKSLKQRLFADWYRYQLCAYPPEGTREVFPEIDEVKHYIELNSLTPLREKVEETGKLFFENQNETITSASSDTPDSIAEELAIEINALISDLNDLSPDSANLLELHETPDARFWIPNEPVVLINGMAAKATDRHGQDGLLDCRVIEDVLPEDGILTKSVFDKIRTNIQNLEKELDNTDTELSEQSPRLDHAFKTYKENPWNPFMLEWEVEVFPIENRSNHIDDERDYETDFFTSNYQLPENEVEPILKNKDESSINKGANIYRGYTYLTNQAEIQMQGKIEDYLEQNGIFESDDDRESQSQKLTQWYESNTGNDLESSNPIYSAIRAYEILTNKESPFYSLSQSFGGFNEALLMSKQTLQLAIADPLGFEEYQVFAKEVADAIGTDIDFSAPQMNNDFNPIRSGGLQVLNIRLVDTFGQDRQFLEPDVGSSRMLESSQPDKFPIMLPPRVVQPARLNFYWLSAEDDHLEMNAHPATTPIFGWLLTNHLDNSLMVYNKFGGALGQINQNGVWEAAPGSDVAVSPVGDDIPILNPHLKKLVNSIIELNNSDNDYLKELIQTTDLAMENIEPDNAEQHTGMALLTGRPIALVRGAVNFELNGLPAIQQSWKEFRADLKRSDREIDNFAQVKLPIRIGEFQQLNDGTVGYWIEDEYGDYKDTPFYQPQNPLEEDSSESATSNHIHQSIDDSASILTLLIDPRAIVHATSGILPTKTLSIPPSQYAKALDAIEASFLTAPLLTHKNQISIPLPEEPGYEWAWIEQYKSLDPEGKVTLQWHEISTTGHLMQQKLIDAFTDGEAIWGLLADENYKWIEEEVDSDPLKATVIPKDQRITPSLEETEYAEQQTAIEQLLDSSYIGKTSTQATFKGNQVLKEGWLKIRKSS